MTHRPPAPDHEVTRLEHLSPDPHNRRARTPRNVAMIVDALQQVGASRSIVIDEHNEILAGNGVAEAAAQAGITRVQVVDLDGKTLLAVRRRGLSDAQKRALAIYDNRTAELAEWNLTQIAADLTNGEDLLTFFGEEELATMTGMFTVADAAVPSLSSGDRAHFQQMTFTLHDDQVDTVKAALAKAREAGCPSDVNENTNGNALAFICEQFRG